MIYLCGHLHFSWSVYFLRTLCDISVYLGMCALTALVVYSSVAVRKWEGRSMSVYVTEAEVDGDEWLLFCSLPPTHHVMMSSSGDTLNWASPACCCFFPTAPQKNTAFWLITRWRYIELVWWTVQRNKLDVSLFMLLILIINISAYVIAL